MFNIYSKKGKQTISKIIVLVLVIAMVLTAIIPYLI